jgi:kinesin family protein 6/9
MHPFPPAAAATHWLGAQVIIALQEMSTGSGRTHVPYRNSMMTSVLRDSLGGNCRTAMIATVATEAESLDESISTCRFALRVAMVSNTITVNEEVRVVWVHPGGKGQRV